MGSYPCMFTVKRRVAHGDNPPLNQTVFNLHELLDEVLWFVANSHGQLDIIREYDPSLPDCLADRDRLHQVFLNLLRNAAEARRRRLSRESAESCRVVIGASRRRLSPGSRLRNQIQIRKAA